MMVQSTNRTAALDNSTKYAEPILNWDVFELDDRYASPCSRDGEQTKGKAMGNP